MHNLDQHIDEWTYEDDQRAEARRDRIADWDIQHGDDEDHHKALGLFDARVHAYGQVDYTPNRNVPAGWLSRCDIDEPFELHDPGMYDPGAVLQCRPPQAADVTPERRAQHLAACRAALGGAS